MAGIDLSIEDEKVCLPPPVNIGGVHVHPIRLKELLGWLDQVIAGRKQALVMYTNAHAINLAQRNPAFLRALNSADLTFCDGYGVRMAAALLGNSLPERFTAPDWIPHLASICAERGYHLFLLGAEPGVAETAADRLRAQNPHLQIAAHHGYFDMDGAENERVLRKIRVADPDLLLVGMGMPRQELWMQENASRLSVPVMMATGALLDYLSGHVTRGPRLLTDRGLEWLCRLWYEPRRLWRRYLLGNPLFLIRVLRQWWMHHM